MNSKAAVLFVSQYVVVPTRRSTAEALQIVISHLLGDAGSPYLIGVVRPHSGALYEIRAIKSSRRDGLSVFLRSPTLWGGPTRTSGSFALCSCLCCSAPSLPWLAEASSSPRRSSSRRTATGPRTLPTQVRCSTAPSLCLFYFLLKVIFFAQLIITCLCQQTTSRSSCPKVAGPRGSPCPASWSDGGLSQQLWLSYWIFYDWRLLNSRRNALGRLSFLRFFPQHLFITSQGTSLEEFPCVGTSDVVFAASSTRGFRTNSTKDCLSRTWQNLLLILKIGTKWRKPSERPRPKTLCILL